MSANKNKTVHQARRRAIQRLSAIALGALTIALEIGRAHV